NLMRAIRKLPAGCKKLFLMHGVIGYEHSEIAGLLGCWMERGLMSKVWLITGASRGFGRAFTKAVLEAGDRVVATARNPEQLVELEDRYSEKVCTIPLDVTNEAQAKADFEQ